MLYLYNEYLREADSPIHAAAIRSSADWIHGLIDPTANGRDQADGRRLIQMYRSLGLHLSSIDDPLEAGILSMSQRMRSGLPEGVRVAVEVPGGAQAVPAG